ncbi:MAG TPA: XTP/dITP diphosphatase [Bacillales bacterium]|nr:XTP/dITP diphosphatase [Bacillales bacterium]
MKKVIIATRNEGKVKEFAALFQRFGIEVRSLLDFEEAIDVEETGTTFAENAMLKAETISKQFGETVIADDSGVVVDALDGRPGVYSARYAGEQKDDEANIDKVLRELEGVPWDKRTARFVCVLAVADPERDTETFSGSCEGLIALERSGENGFGYDPVFYLPDREKTMAELSKSEKNRISHRARAMKKMESQLDVLKS